MKYTEGKLTRELRYTYGIPKVYLADWVCLINNASAMDTKAMTTSPDGTKNYGIFQINEKLCGELCNATPQDLLNDDIADAAKCALKIYEFHKFNAWAAWVENCQGKPLKSVTKYL